jgi:hypothetical protein
LTEKLIDFDVNMNGHAIRNATGVGGKRFDLYGDNKITTASCTAGTYVSGSIDLGVSTGIVERLRVKALSNTTNANIEFYANAGLSDRIYLAENKNCYIGHIDSTPWAIGSMDSDLVSDLMYYKVTNSGQLASVFTIEMRGSGI